MKSQKKPAPQDNETAKKNLTNREIMNRAAAIKISWVLGMQLILAGYILTAAYIPRLSWILGGPVAFSLVVGLGFFIFFRINLKLTVKFERLYNSKRAGNLNQPVYEIILIIIISILFMVQPFIVPYAVAVAGPSIPAVSVDELKNKIFTNIEEITGYRFSKNGLWRYQSRVFHPKIGKVGGFTASYNVFPLLPDRDPASSREMFKRTVHKKDFRSMIDEYRKEISPDKKLGWIHIDEQYLDPVFKVPVDTFGSIFAQEMMFKDKKILSTVTAVKPRLTVLRADPLDIPDLINAIKEGYPGIDLTSADTRNIYRYTPVPSSRRGWIFFLAMIVFVIPNALYIITVLKGKPSSSPYFPAPDEEMKTLSFLNRLFLKNKFTS